MISINSIIQHLLPKHLLSRLMAKLTNCNIPWLKNYLITTFIKKYSVNMEEAEQPTSEHYKTFNAFFIRHLKPGVRPLGNASITSPADGSICEFGTVENGQLLQAKGHPYTLDTLLGNDKNLVENFNGGGYLTIYLSPKDYHRVHMPYTGSLKQMIYVPGELYSVNTETTQSIPNIFAKNERVIALFDSDIGSFAVILVGACLVAGIHTQWHGQVAPGKNKTPQIWNYSDDKIALAKGDEMGHFQFGSTAIILFPKDTVQWAEHLAIGSDIRLGQGIGYF